MTPAPEQRVDEAGSVAPTKNRIDARFQAMRDAKRKGLIPFITAGDPSADGTVDVMHALVAGGADLIELGVPFSDPMADGPVIQLASERALARGVGLRRVLQYVRAFRERDATTPVVLMGYLNPIEIYGYARFAADAVAAGVDGVLLVDLPVEEADDVLAQFAAHGLHVIFLAAPTTRAARVDAVAAKARGFLYYVSFAGITGADGISLDDIGERVAALRAHATAPIAIGFGIKTPEQAATLAAFADAVVVGSALVAAIAGVTDAPVAARAFVAPLRAALDAIATD